MKRMLMTMAMMLVTGTCAFAAEPQVFSLSRGDVTQVNVTFTPKEEGVRMKIQLSAAKARELAKITQDNLGKTIEVRIMGEVVSRPLVKETIAGASLELIMKDHLLAVGLARQLTMEEEKAPNNQTARWEQRASGIALGTPRHEVEKVLPPSGSVIDLRSSRGAAGPVSYWVDDTTVVKLWYNEHDCLGRPVIVEQKKNPEAKKANGGDVQ